MNYRMAKRKVRNAFRDAFNGWFGTKAALGEPTSTQPVAYNVRVSQSVSEFALTQGDFITFVDEAYRLNPKIYGAINLIADTAIMAPLRVVDAKDENKVLPDHKTQKVLDHINDQHTPKQFQKKLIQHLYLGSVAFIEKVFDDNFDVTELGLLRPDQVEIFTDRENREISHFRYQPIPNEEIPREKIIPMRFIDPIEDYKGFSPVWALATSVETDNIARKHVFSTLKNGGMPAVHIKIEEGDDEGQRKRVKKRYDQQTTGDNYGSSIVTDKDTIIEQLGFDFNQLDISGISNITEAEILTTMKIPPTVYASISGQMASTHDNLQTGLKMFWEHNLIPLHNMIEDYLNSDPDLTDGYTVKIKYDRSGIEALQVGLKEKEEIWGRAFDRGGAKLNEYREKIGLPKLETPEGEQFKPAPSTSFTMNTGNDNRNSGEKSEIKSGADHTSFEALQEDEPDKGKPCHVGTDRTPEECKMIELKVAVDRFRIADEGAIEVVKLVDRALRGQIKDVLGVIGTKMGKNVKQFESNRIKSELNQLKEGWIKEFDESDAISDVFAKSAEQASLQLNQSFDIEPDEARAAVRAEQFKFAKNVSEESAKQISQIIDSAFAEGKSLRDLSRDIQALGEQWTKTRANTIARTETAKAANRGAREGYKSAGAKFLRYSAILDGATTEICRSLDGKIVSINSPFLTEKEGHTLSNGKQMDLSYNGGVPDPGTAHPNCRSTHVPVNEDGSLLI